MATPEHLHEIGLLDKVENNTGKRVHNFDKSHMSSGKLVFNFNKSHLSSNSGKHDVVPSELTFLTDPFHTINYSLSNK